MATAPVKSPLHNFPLTFLKWGSKNHQRCRRPFDSPPRPSPPATTTTTDAAAGSRSSRNRRTNHHHQKQLTPTREVEDERESSKPPAEAEEAEEKPWNLRPRRAAMKAPEIQVQDGSENNLPKSMRLRGLETQGEVGEKRERKRFWIALSRDEIEEDIYSLTGSKPSRRPRKRPKNVQKQLDNVFPGLWLVGVSPEAYRGLDAPTRR